MLYPGLVERAEQIMEEEHEAHAWYWNPWESREEYDEKREKAAATGNLLPAYRPNGMNRLPWEQ